MKTLKVIVCNAVGDEETIIVPGSRSQLHQMLSGPPASAPKWKEPIRTADGEPVTYLGGLEFAIGGVVYTLVDPEVIEGEEEEEEGG